MRTKKVYAAALLAASSLGVREAGAAGSLSGYWVQDNSSVKIHITSAPTGTYDYRVCADADFDQTHYTCSGTVKYAGRMPGGGGADNTTSVPNPEIEWQFPDAATHTLYVEAVNALGPVPVGNLIDFAADALITTSPPTCSGMPSPIAGADYGCTSDGMLAINGQGDGMATPAQVKTGSGQPIYLQISNVGGSPSTVPLPSASDALQVVFDSFDSSEDLSALMVQVGQQYQTPGAPNNGLQMPPTDGVAADGEWGMTNYVVNGQPVPWDILYSDANVDTGLGNGTIPSNPSSPQKPVSFTKPFFRMNGFDDILLSGSNAAWEDYEANQGAAWNEQRDEKYASMAITPKVAAELSNDKMLHVTFEVDAQFFAGDRWASVVIAPANDPVASFRFDDLVQSTGQSSVGSDDEYGLQVPSAGHNTTDPTQNANLQGLNAGNQALWVQFLAGGCDAALFDGPNNVAYGADGNFAPDAIQAGGVNFIAQDFAVDVANAYSTGAVEGLPSSCDGIPANTQACCPTGSSNACWVNPTDSSGNPQGVAQAGCYPAAFCAFPGYFMSQNKTWPAATLGYTQNKAKTKTYPVWGGLRPNAVACSRAPGTGQVSNGRGLDDRSRFDVFLSAGDAAAGTPAHHWIFEDGYPLADSVVYEGGLQGTPVALPFTSAKVYFVHYAYAIDDKDEGAHLPAQGSPTAPGSGALGPNAYWQSTFSENDAGVPIETSGEHGEPLLTANGAGQNGSFPYSDHRHWDNMGFEVLPAYYSTTATTASLQGRIGTPCSASNPCPTQTPALTCAANGLCVAENSVSSAN